MGPVVGYADVPKPAAARPFLKWAGGKGQLLPELLKRVPEKFKQYHEPFIGGGALFFALRPRIATLGDANHELILTYVAVRDNVDLVVACLREYERIYRRAHEKYFYQVRESYPNGKIDTAARMIFLNKTCFNGLYRVNKSGKFNVPHGKYENPAICDEENLLQASSALQNTGLVREDFRLCESRIGPGDFVYFDPPYLPLNKTSDFRSYTSAGFNVESQLDLVELAVKLRDRGAHVLLSNSSATGVREMYEKRGFIVEEVGARRAINSRGSKRGMVKELLIRGTP